jgi:aminoglycoside phosphotransferase (APT) family kinase protein
MTGDATELIDPRPGEALESSRLEPYLRARLPNTDGPFSFRQFGGGHANLTYEICFGGHAYVLRRPPPGPVAPSSHDMKREHRVLARLYEVFPLAPRSYLHCGDSGIIGAEFHVMERRRGIVIRTEVPKHFAGDLALVRRIGEMIVDTLAALHTVPPEVAGLGDLGRPEGYVERQLDGWTKRWHAAKDHDLVRVDAIIARLHRRVPHPPAVSLLHNDYKLDNMLVDAEDPGRAVAVLDWDMCTRGDPLMDLGYLLNCWAEPSDDPEWRNVASMPTWQPGFPSRAEVIARYGKATAYELADVGWYHLFGVFKLIVIIQQLYIRFLRGHTLDQRFATYGARVAALAEKGAVLMVEDAGR